MGLLNIIRRMRLRQKLSIREISRVTGMSRNTVTNHLAANTIEPKFATPERQSRIDPFAEKLAGWPKTEAGKSRKKRRTVKQLHADLVTLGFTGSYARFATFARRWRADRQREQQTTRRGTFVPLHFDPGDAFQFEWSEDFAVLGSERTKLQMAHINLSHSRAFLLWTYPDGPLEGIRAAGIDLKGSVAFSYQGLTAGDGAKDWRGGGKADLWITLDEERLGLGDGFSIAVHPEVTFGDSANDTGAGVLTPPNTMLAFPTLGGSDTELSVVLSQNIGTSTNVSFGKFNLLDIAAKTPIAGGGGLDTFMNVAIAAPISGVTPPYLLGAIGTVKTEPAIYTLMIYDPRNAQDSDVVSNPFSEGTTVSLSTTFPTKIGGRTTFIGLRGVYSTATGIDLESLPNLALPGEASDVLQLDGYRYAGLNFQHYLAEDPARPGNGWGIFGDLGLSDGNPNPVGWHAILGVAGTGTARSSLDRWGVAWFKYGLSDDLKDGLAVFGIDRRDESGVEAFYNVALTPWLRLTADAQWVQPTTGGKDDAVFLGLRLQTLF